METMLPWEEQALSDPDALCAFIGLCEEVRQDVGSYPVVYHRTDTHEQMAQDMAYILAKHESEEMWFVGGKQDEEGVHLLAFCGNGPHSQSKAYFIQMALQFLPLLLRNQLEVVRVKVEDEAARTCNPDDLATWVTGDDYQLRNTES
jgi:hypothetical protein